MNSSSILVSILIIIILIVEQSTICCLAKNNVTFDCVPKEKKALLRFKASLFDPSNRLSSWNTNYECCSWAGVECDKASGHVIGLHLGNSFIENDYDSDSMLRSEMLDSSLLELKYLRYLDLSCNDFQGSSIPASLGSMKQLQHLNLSSANFTGVVPRQLGNLASLRALDLGSSDVYQYIGVYVYKLYHFVNRLIIDDLTWAINLSSLEYLDMSQVNLSRTKDLVKVLGTLPSLVVLRLSYSELDNTNLPHTNCSNSTLFANAQYLDLRGNLLEGDFPCFLHNMTSLSFLDLSYNRYNSSGHHPFPRLMNLSYLDLSGNSLNHNIDWISDFLSDKYCRLKSLNLNSNQFYGDISGAFRNLSRCSSHNLESLDSGYNKLYGHLPEELGELKLLTKLDVSYNNLSGPIPSSLRYLRALTALDLSSNQLSGEIPIFFGQLSNLEYIDISFNAFDGTLSEAHFANLSKLELFYIDSNNMSQLRVSYDWVPPFQLKYLDMRSVDIEGPFPQWLRTQKALIHLDLSNCSITGTLPKWLDSLVTLFELDLSDNHIKGQIPSDIGQMMPNLSKLDVSGNLINGSIPDSLCEMKNLEYLDLSKNHLSGNLPNCWEYSSSLMIARFSSNQLSGAIPNSIGGAHRLRNLHLDNNSLSGQLPSNLKNCTYLEVLDVGDNKLSGELPEWIGTDLLDLRALRLRNNNFYGDIPSTYCQLSKSQIMDLADNNLTGNIPHCFGNFSGMIDDGTTPSFPSGRYTGSFSEVMTGVMREYKGITLELLVHLDLSKNHLVGQIPSEITILTALLGLNLSHNHLEGKIPGNIGEMKQLISLDLSSNNLSGTIPGSLSKLNFLSHMNLSGNNLSGKIPTGSQLQTFNDPSDYAGNPGLCGDPLPKKCQVINQTRSKVERDADDDDDDGVIIDKIYLYASILSGIATGFWGFIGVLVFKRSWRLALFRYMDTMIGRMMGLY